MSETSQTVAAGQLRAFIERIERIEADIKELNADKSDVYKELRGAGFDVKAVRQCVAARKLDMSELQERNAIFDLYWEALTGGSRVHVHEEPLGMSAYLRKEDMPPHDSVTGEIDEHPIHERPSINDEASPKAGPQAEAFQSQGTGAGTLAGHEGRSEGEAASADLPTNSEPASPLPVSEQAGDAAPKPSPATPSAMTARTKADVMRLMRPNCLHIDDLENCAGQGTKHCHACITAAAERESA